MGPALVDTSAVYALLDKSDRNHDRAKQTLKRMSREGYRPFLTNFLVAESQALILSRLGRELARRWLEQVAWPIARATADDEYRARMIIAEYHDKAFSYTDAVSFSIMERLEVSQAFAYDHHFAQFGFTLV